MTASLAACELNTYQTDEVYASTPPLEAKRPLHSTMATQRTTEDGRPREISFLDVKTCIFPRGTSSHSSPCYPTRTWPGGKRRGTSSKMCLRDSRRWRNLERCVRTYVGEAWSSTWRGQPMLFLPHRETSLWWYTAVILRHLGEEQNCIGMNRVSPKLLPSS